MDVYEEEAKSCGKSDSMSLVGSKELNVFMRGSDSKARAAGVACMDRARPAMVEEGKKNSET